MADVSMTRQRRWVRVSLACHERIAQEAARLGVSQAALVEAALASDSTDRDVIATRARLAERLQREDLEAREASAQQAREARAQFKAALRAQAHRRLLPARKKQWPTSS